MAPRITSGFVPPLHAEKYRWVSSVTGQIMNLDEWYMILKKVYDMYPNTYENSGDEDVYLLRDDIGWGYSDNNFSAAKRECTVNYSNNNSPQIFRQIGGGRRVRMQFIIMEMTYRHTTKSKTDVFNNPPYLFMGTKRIIEHALSANPYILFDQGITFIENPSVVTDGRNFGNFGLVNNFPIPNSLIDNNKWKFALLYLIHVDETVI